MVKQLVDRIRKYKWLNYNLGYLVSLSTYFSYPFKAKRTPDRKFVIYGSGRSGSTLLVSLLDSHSEIFCDNEIYHRRVISPARYLRLRTRMGNARVYGFKLLTYHLGHMLGLDKTKYNDYLKSLHKQGYRIIYLRRENVFRQALSNLYARQSNQFHNQGNKGKKAKIRVNIGELDRWMQGLARQAKLEAGYLEGIPHLALTYESHLSDGEKQQGALQELCAFLDINYEAPQTKLRKNTPKSLASFIENHEEVEAFLKKSELAQVHEKV